MAHVTRRSFLKGCSAAIAALAGSRLTRLSVAASYDAQEIETDTLVVVFLRGGWDALSVLAPLDGPDRGHYESARPTLKISPHSLLALDDQFGLHPAMAPLYDLYQDGSLAVVRAAGLNVGTRSHFDAMEYMELGTPGIKRTTTGWLTRHLQSAPGLPDSLLLPAIVSTGQPAALLNYGETVQMANPSDLSLWDNGVSLPQQQHVLRLMYAGNDLSGRVGRRTLDALEVAKRAGELEYVPAQSAVYAEDGFSANLKTIAQMIKLGAGLKVAAVDLGGWDTHEYQADGSSGYLADLLGQLATGLAAFYADLSGSGPDSDYTRRLSVVVMSEFGRRLVQNESQGTDHGHGSLMLALGGGVNGGQMFGEWPGLSNEQLYEHADLAVTTDYRHVLGELLETRLANPNLEVVFPGFSSYQSLGVFRPG